MRHRINQVFQEVVRIKKAILANNGVNLTEFTTDLLKTINERERPMRKLAAIYSLGEAEFYRIKNSREESCLKGELATI